MRILVADDLPQVRSALRLFLEHQLPYCVIDEVADAKALLGQVQAAPPDLALLDWNLPGLAENDTLRRLRRCYPDLLIIVLSGQAEAHSLALAAGADAFVSKGQSPEHLLTILDKFQHGGMAKMKQELIKDWMTSTVVAVSPETTLPEAHRLMTENGIRRLPVVNQGRLVGIVTLGDVRQAEPSDATSLSVWEMNYLLSKLKVERIMTRDPLTISPNKTIGEAAGMMLKNKVSGLPVVDEQGQVIGIITESDIFRLVVNNWGGIGVNCVEVSRAA